MAKFSLRNLFRREAAPTQSTIHTYTVASSSGEVHVVTYEQALRIATVEACVERLSSTVAKLPLEFQRWNSAKGVFIDYVNSPLFYVLSRRPNRWQTAYAFWYAVVAQMKLSGNAYAYIDRAGADIAQLIFLTPGSVTYNEVNDTYIVNDIYHRIAGTFDPSEILHFANIAIDGRRVGKSAIELGERQLSIQATADRETLSRFASGGKMKALLTNNTSVQGFGEYDKEEMEKLAAQVERKLATRDIVALTGDAHIHQLNMSSSDLQILESRKYGVIEICRMFSVPPSKIYADFNHAYNAGETANVEFLTDTIDPILTSIEQELESKLLSSSPTVMAHYRIVFDRDKMFTVNSITKADYYNKMLQTGAWAVNDVRRKENMPAIEGGDVVLISCNVAPITSPKITGEEKSGQPIEKNTNE